MSNETFRFLTVRQPQRASPDKIERISVRASNPADPSVLHRELAKMRAMGQPRKALVTRARGYLQSADFALGSGVPLAVPMNRLALWLSAQVRPLAPSVVKDALPDVLGESLDHLLASDAYRSTRERVADSLIAASITPEGEDGSRPRLVELMRAHGLIDGLADHLNDPRYVETSLSSVVLLPADVFPLPKAEDPFADERREAHKAELECHEAARQAIADLLLELDRDDFGAQIVDPGRLGRKAPDVRLTSGEAGRDRHAETRHPVDHRTAHPRLGFLPSQTPGA